MPFSFLLILYTVSMATCRFLCADFCSVHVANISLTHGQTGNMQVSSKTFIDASNMPCLAEVGIS